MLEDVVESAHQLNAFGPWGVGVFLDVQRDIDL